MPSDDPSLATLPGGQYQTPAATTAVVGALRRIAWAGIAGWPLISAGLWQASSHFAAGYIFGIHAIAFYGVLRANCGLYGPVVKRFATDRKEVWLTIDDGPFPEDTAEMLAVLARHQTPATFFLEGARVQQAPELARAITAAGHSIGNHSQNHRVAWFWSVGPGCARREVTECDAALEAVGAAPIGFRAPVGMANYFVHRAAQNAGLPVIGWSARGFDGLDRDPQRVIARLLPKIRPGAIVLLHQRRGRRAGEPGNAPILAALLETLAARGYRCVLPSPKQFLSL